METYTIVIPVSRMVVTLRPPPCPGRYPKKRREGLGANTSPGPGALLGAPQPPPSSQCLRAPPPPPPPGARVGAHDAPWPRRPAPPAAAAAGRSAPSSVSSPSPPPPTRPATSPPFRLPASPRPTPHPGRPRLRKPPAPRRGRPAHRCGRLS